MPGITSRILDSDRNETPRYSWVGSQLYGEWDEAFATKTAAEIKLGAYPATYFLCAQDLVAHQRRVCRLLTELRGPD